eukprot:1161328-Pelagomonas_calceolata.AAC.1
MSPAPDSFATEMQGLLFRKSILERMYSSKKIKNSFSRALPTHIHIALQKWALVTQEKMAFPLDHNPQYHNYWSVDSRDNLFGAMHNAFSSNFSGFSVCHLIYDGGIMPQALQHAIYSAIINTEATASFMFLPAWGRHMITNPYSNLSLSTPTSVTTSEPSHITLPEHTWDLRILSVWNKAGRIHLNSQNKDWLQGLAGDLKETTEWNLRNVSSHPVLNPRHADMPGFRKPERLPLDRQHVSNTFKVQCPANPVLSSPSKLLTGGHGHIQMEAALSITVGKKLEQASITHLLTTRTL